MPHGIGNIGDKISSKESHDAHGNVPSGKRLTTVLCTLVIQPSLHMFVASCRIFAMS